MMPLSSTFTAADKTDVLAAGNIAEMSLQQWVGTNVALCCCRMNMPSAGRAKLADCNAHENKKSSANSCRSCVCQSCVELHKELLTRRSCSNRMQMQRTTRTSCLKQEGAAARRSCVASSPHNQFWGSDFPSHMKKLTLLGNVSPLHPPRSRC